MVDKVAVNEFAYMYSEYSLIRHNWFRRNFGRLTIWWIILIFFEMFPTICSAVCTFRVLFLHSEIYFFCFIVKSVLEDFVAILLYTKTTSLKLEDYL